MQLYCQNHLLTSLSALNLTLGEVSLLLRNVRERIEDPDDNKNTKKTTMSAHQCIRFIVIITSITSGVHRLYWQRLLLKCGCCLLQCFLQHVQQQYCKLASQSTLRPNLSPDFPDPVSIVCNITSSEFPIFLQIYHPDTQCSTMSIRRELQ